MDFYRLIKSCSVKVNNGSGVIVSSMSKDFDYILSVKHNISLSAGSSDNDIIVVDYTDNHIRVLDKVIIDEPENDILILKIEKQKVEYFISSKFVPSQATNLLTFSGYPGFKRSNNNKSEEEHLLYNCEINDEADGYFKLYIPESPSIELIRGMSGGGIFQGKNGFIELIGIESDFAGVPELEYGKVNAFKIKKYEHMLSIFNLPPFAPFFMSCFSELISNSFNIKFHKSSNFTQARSALHELAKALVHVGLPKPYQLLEKYKNELLVEGENHASLYCEDLWCALLEFLLILSILNDRGSLDISYLDSIKRKYRLVYTSFDDDWLQDFKNILKTAKKLLNKNGTLLVVSKDLNSEACPPDEILAQIVDDIGDVGFELVDGRIDVANDTSALNYKYVSFKASQNELIKRQEINISKMNINDFFDYLKGKYSVYIEV